MSAVATDPYVPARKEVLAHAVGFNVMGLVTVAGFWTMAMVESRWPNAIGIAVLALLGIPAIWQLAQGRGLPDLPAAEPFAPRAPPKQTVRRHLVLTLIAATAATSAHLYMFSFQGIEWYQLTFMTPGDVLLLKGVGTLAMIWTGILSAVLIASLSGQLEALDWRADLLIVLVTIEGLLIYGGFASLLLRLGLVFPAS